MGASKDGDKYLLLARELPSSGLALVRFDFRGSGQSGGLYRDATIGSRITDVEAMLGHLARHPALDGRFGLLGSSLGGFVALWAASRRADGVPVVMWNARRRSPISGGACAEPAEPGALLRRSTGRHVEAPGVRSVLVIQGEADDTVPPSHARALFERAAEPRELLMLPGADHRLTEPEHRRAAVEASRRWFLRHLGK
jgi:dipeptidyl aminopeptidase/acylaminoacyl peptidase